MAPPAPGTPHVRVMFDGDHDMTRAEVADHVGKMFAKLDTNHDGFITKDEVEAMHAKMMSAMEKGGDVREAPGRARHDGWVTAAPSSTSSTPIMTATSAARNSPPASRRSAPSR